MKNSTHFGYLLCAIMLFVFLISPCFLLAADTPAPGEAQPPNAEDEKKSKKTTIIGNAQIMIDGKIQTIGINFEYTTETEKDEKDDTLKVSDFYEDCVKAVEELYKKAKDEMGDETPFMKKFDLAEIIVKEGKKLLCEGARDAVVALIQQGASRVNEHFGGRNLVRFETKPEGTDRNINLSLWEGIKGALDLEIGKPVNDAPAKGKPPAAS